MDQAADSDEALMMRYVKGDMAAFEMLYERHKGPIYRYLLRLSRNETVAEELFQEVWMKLIKTSESFSETMRFAKYFYKLAHNHFIDYYRKQKIREVINQAADAVAVMTLPAEGDPEQALSMEQMVDQFDHALNSLPREQLEVFLLKEEAGMKLQEIAEVIGVDYETAKSRMRYAVGKLKTVLRN
ncbi:MAG: sigma-70 family RNA polymerase sigma factor [Gammaproteobacteria bacterium]